MRRTISGCLALFLIGGFANAEEWAQFRGPSGQGIATSVPPTEWGDSTNLKWAVRLPGPGCSSPIVVGGKVFVTAYSGYGVDRAKPGDIEQLKRHLLCFDRQSGEMLWVKTPPTEQPEDKYEGFITDHGYASSTPASDGNVVVAFFGKSGVFAFDMQGELQWRTIVGSESGPSVWGSGASLIVHDGLAIVNACDESQSLIALNLSTGDEVWRAEASKYEGSYATPLLVDLPNGKKEIVVPLATEIWGFEPSNGELLWRVQKSLGKYIMSTPVTGNGLLYVASSHVAAIKLGGNGDVTNSHVVWERNAGPGMPSSIVDGDKLYWMTTSGVISCMDARTGKRIWRKRLPTSRGRNTTYASLVKAGDLFFATTQTNGVFVFRVEPKFSLVSHNQFSRDPSVFKASPAISGGELFLRSNRFLYCIAESGAFDFAAVSEKEATLPKEGESFAVQFQPGNLRSARSANSVSPADLLVSLDEDDDGRVSRAELAESPMPKLVQAMMFQGNDANRDGFIDADERKNMKPFGKAKPGDVVGRIKSASRPLRPVVHRQPSKGEVVPANND